MARKIKAVVSSFVFQGRHERLKLAKLQNPVDRGGLGLTCVATKAECLLLRQTIRILTRPQQNCSRHLGHWLGFFLQESFQDLMEQGQASLAMSPQFPLHTAMLEMPQEGLLRLEYTPITLHEINTRTIYQGRAGDVVPPPTT